MIRVEKITTGCFWVENHSLGKKVLCGCPPDTVKFMLQKGVLAPKMENGVRFESGPDAILLADLSLRYGKFWNLSEFPILQMLYRQGLMIPNHPNNDGRKPILIGLKEQVEAKKRYILRGNYGLTSLEELMEAGLDQSTAEKMMAIKLHFAFGRLQNADDIIDCLHLDAGPAEIVPGFWVEHTGLNQYRFHDQKSEVVVNLNPEPGERLQAPFYVNPVQLHEGYFSVIH